MRHQTHLLTAVLFAMPLLACACAQNPPPAAAHPPTSSATTSAATSAATPATLTAPALRCTAPEYRQLDMWVGDWDAYDRDDLKTPAARTHVDRVAGGCALREVYEQNDGLIGESYLFFDSSRKAWHQTWVTNKGQVLDIDGNLKGDTLVLQGMHRGGNAPDKTVRISWQREGDGVREWAESSPDGGATWKPMFDMVFRPHRADARVGQAQPTP